MEKETIDPNQVVADIFGGNQLLEFAIRYGFNLLVMFIIVRLIYYPRHKNKDFLFTFFLFNTLNFLICFLLSATKLKMGFAFGLFAIFSIIRYRTVMVPIREMGYFFVSVSLALVNSLAVIPDKDSMILIGAANLITVIFILALDGKLMLEHENFKLVTYERIDLIRPERREEMLEDLRYRTGLPIHRIEILKFDFLRDVARIHAFYYAAENESKSIATGDGGDD